MSRKQVKVAKSIEKFLKTRTPEEVSKKLWEPYQRWCAEMRETPSAKRDFKAYFDKRPQ